jgi:hypothetical protein
MRHIGSGFTILFFVFCLGRPAAAEWNVSIAVGMPHLQIGINLPVYPELVVVPGYPVYYAPYVDANYFFYDGFYWVYQNDYWYSSNWYNGPWLVVEPEMVPLFILRIPVGFYQRPPPYFRGWYSSSPPHWGEHWGRDWERRHRGWDRWRRETMPPPAPRPDYQRDYGKDHYPGQEQQQRLHRQQYHYQPRDVVVREQYRQRSGKHERRSPTDERRQYQGPTSYQRQNTVLDQRQKSYSPWNYEFYGRGQKQERGYERSRGDDERDRGDSKRDRGRDQQEHGRDRD